MHGHAMLLNFFYTCCCNFCFCIRGPSFRFSNFSSQMSYFGRVENLMGVLGKSWGFGKKYEEDQQKYYLNN